MNPIHLDNLRIEVTRKPIRTLRMRICPPDAEVFVSAPLHVSETEVLRFVRDRREWILRHRERILADSARRQAPLCGEAGEQITVWGRARTLLLCPASRPGLLLEEDTLRLFVPGGCDTHKRLGLLHSRLRTLLMQRMTELADLWVPVMQTPWPELRIRRMKSRWGTCNPRARRVWINADLVHHVPESLEYVMVHELAHLHESGHTDRFRAILDRHLPDWRERRSRLNTG